MQERSNLVSQVSLIKNNKKGKQSTWSLVTKWQEPTFWTPMDVALYCCLVYYFLCFVF
jgi:hypothetical protein